METPRFQPLVDAVLVKKLQDLVRTGGTPPCLALDDAGSKTSLARIAIRALHVHCVVSPLVLARPADATRGESAPAALVAPPAAPGADRMDLRLANEDASALEELAGHFDGDSSAAIRAAFALLLYLHTELRRADGRALYRETSEGLSEFALQQIANRPLPTRRQAQIPLVMHAASPTAPAPATRSFADSVSSHVIAVVLFVDAFNVHVGETHLRTSPTIAVTEPLTLLTRLEGYGAEAALRDMHLRAADYGYAWTPDIRAEVLEQAARKALRAYLTAAHERRLYSPVLGTREPGAPIAEWRHWGRQILVGDWSEAEGPVYWIYVLHHMFATNALPQLPWRGTPGIAALAAHDIQYALLDGFDLHHHADLGALLAAAGAVNQLLFGESVVHTRRVFAGTLARCGTRELVQAIADAIDPVASGAPARPGESTRPPRATERAFGLYLFLVVGQFLRPVLRWHAKSPGAPVQRLERPLTAVNISEYRARVFGAQTAVNGLHWIMRGGIIPSIDGGRVWSIMGEPGAGKSTYALHQACDIASRGRLAIYVSTEESTSAVRERILLNQLGNDRFVVLERAEFEALLTQRGGAAQQPTVAPHQGILVLLSGEAAGAEFDLGQWIDEVVVSLDNLKRRAREEHNKVSERYARSSDPAERAKLADEASLIRRALQRYRWRAVFVDSADAMKRVDQAAIDDAAALVQKFKERGVWGNVICGASEPMRERLRFLADAVLDIRFAEGATYRTITILKNRAQPFDPGAHRLYIREGRGVRITPNLMSIQRATQRQPRAALDLDRGYFTPLSFQPGEAGRGGVWGGDLPRSTLVRRTSRVLLTGEPQSGKGLFLYHMLISPLKLAREPDWKLGPTGGVLVVSFRSNEQEFVRRFVPNEEDRALARAAICAFDVRWYSPGDQLHGSNITRELVERIRRQRRDGFIPIEIVVFDEIEAIRTNFPHLAKDDSFWPTTLALLSGEGVTSYFVTSDRGAPGDFVHRHGQDMDYVFDFERRPDELGTCVATLRRSPDAGGSVAMERRAFRIHGRNFDDVSVIPPG